MFSCQLAPVPTYTAWWTDAHVCEQLFRVVRESELGLGFDALTTTPPRHTHTHVQILELSRISFHSPLTSLSERDALAERSRDALAVSEWRTIQFRVDQPNQLFNHPANPRTSAARCRDCSIHATTATKDTLSLSTSTSSSSHHLQNCTSPIIDSVFTRGALQSLIKFT